MDTVTRRPPALTTPVPIMTVDGIMSRDVVTVGPDTTLPEVRALLYDGDTRHLLVVEQGTLLGIISERDVLRALRPFLDAYAEQHNGEIKSGEMKSPCAKEIMHPEPVTVTPKTEVEEASTLLLDSRASSLPVVEGEVLKGIVTTGALLRHYTNGR